MEGIDLNRPIAYHAAALRRFRPGEHHVKRIGGEDVLLLVRRGILRFTEDGHAYELSAGQYHIQKKGSRQDGEQESDCPEYLYVHFEGVWGTGSHCLPADGTFDLARFAGPMERMERAAGGASNLTERSGLFYGLLSALHQQTLEKHPGHAMARRILNALSGDLRNPPSLEELAVLSHFSRNYVIELVKEYCGKTPYQYLGELRLQRAALLLESSALPLEEIADQCGYSDYSHFYKCFHSAYGCAPGRYRRGAR